MVAPDDHINMFVAVKYGEVERLRALLAEKPELANTRLEGVGRTPLLVVADWPGYSPNGPRIAQMLIDAGADTEFGADDGSGETPLHWAASSDDSDVAAVLIAAGANIEKPDGSIGTPLANAVGYGCWNVARLLVASGAKVDCLWIAAALGLLERLEELLSDEDLATPENISQAFWHACAGHQRRAAELLLARGADLSWTPPYAQGTPLDAASGTSTRQNNVIEWLTSLGAKRSSGD